jgi:hypothetical protein
VSDPRLICAPLVSRKGSSLHIGQVALSRGSGGPFFENLALPRSDEPCASQMGSSLRGVLLVRSGVVERDAHGCWTGAMQAR